MHCTEEKKKKKKKWIGKPQGDPSYVPPLCLFRAVNSPCHTSMPLEVSFVTGAREKTEGVFVWLISRKRKLKWKKIKIKKKEKKRKRSWSKEVAHKEKSTTWTSKGQPRDEVKSMASVVFYL